MKKVGKRHHDSAEKLFGYVGLLAKEPIHIVFDEQYEIKYEPPKRAIISGTLFQTDGCQSSGRCCKVAFDLIYTREGRDRVAEAAKVSESAGRLFDALQPLETTVNGKPVEVWTHLNDKVARYTEAKTCDFLEHPQEGDFKGKFICGVHGGYNKIFESAQPFHCIAPHFVVRQRGDGSSFIGRMQFGRNWRFGCPVVFQRGDQYFDKDHQQDIDKLTMMQSIADDIGVSTWIPEMIDWLKSNVETIRYMIKTGEYQNVDMATLAFESEGYSDIFS